MKLNEYVGKNALKKAAEKVGWPDLDENPALIDEIIRDCHETLQRARVVSVAYTRMKNALTGERRKRCSETGKTFKTFIKVAKKLKTRQIASYVRAHFDTFGADMYAEHLLSPQSDLIYHSYMIARLAPRMEMGAESRRQYEARLLIMMSDIWKLPVERVYALLRPLFPTLESLYGEDFASLLKGLPTEAVGTAP